MIEILDSIRRNIKDFLHIPTPDEIAIQMKAKSVLIDVEKDMVAINREGELIESTLKKIKDREVLDLEEAIENNKKIIQSFNRGLNFHRSAVRGAVEVENEIKKLDAKL